MGFSTFNLIILTVVLCTFTRVSAEEDYAQQLQMFSDFMNSNNMSGLMDEPQGDAPKNQPPAGQTGQDLPMGEPTRSTKEDNSPSTFPPLVHQEGNANETGQTKAVETTNAPTTQSSIQTTPGVANFCKVNLSVFIIVCVFHILH